MVRNNTFRWLGLFLILLTGFLHLVSAGEEASEAAYMGVLFGANFLGSLLAALGISRRQIWGWVLGFVIAVGSVAGYITSRTVGMPGMEVEEWLDPIGVAAMLAESVFILLFILRIARVPSGNRRTSW